MAAAPALAALALSGCGQGSPAGSPAAGGLPLASGSHLIADVRRCDGGAHPFCARELVLVGRPGRYRGSGALLAAEAHRLRAAGWSESKGDTDYETAAESPGQRLRLQYATAAHDLLSADEGRIPRAAPIAQALSAQMFARTPALSITLQAGSS